MVSPLTTAVVSTVHKTTAKNELPDATKSPKFPAASTTSRRRHLFVDIGTINSGSSRRAPDPSLHTFNRTGSHIYDSHEVEVI